MRFSSSQMQAASYFWSVGCSTLEIASRLKLSEAVVYNNVDAIKRFHSQRLLELQMAPDRAL